MDEDRAIVIDCAVCKRTIWANSVCTHGQIPDPEPPAAPVGGPKVDPEPKKVRRGK